MSCRWKLVEIITPSALRAKHFGYILNNGVKCIVVQDPNAKVPAVALNMRAGQLNDTVDVPGLAHFCEHMLFMGTAKYPREDEYDSYITKNGGFCNAWTADRGTTYYFTVAHDALEGALERFVEFFVAPSFNSSAISREVKAVHSEDEKNHSVDFWRIDELERSLFSEQHPRSRYGNGNMTTLWHTPLEKQIDIRADLIKFFDTHYVSGAACIAVCSVLPPEAILQMIEEPLSRMRMGAPAEFRFLPPEEPLFNPLAAQGLWINVHTIKKTRSVRMLWPVKCPAASWRYMPGAYVAHVLGHECNCSVLGVLRREGMATGMVVWPQQVDADNAIFSVDISLTVNGVRRLADVIDTVYHGIGQATRVDMAVYQQMKAEEHLVFESSDVNGNADHCVGLAYSANETDLRHCWIAEVEVLEDNIAETEAFVAQLTPDKAVIMFRWGEMPLSEGVAGATGEERTGEEGEMEEGSEAEAEAEVESSENLFQSLPDFARVPCNSATRFHGTKYVLCRVPVELRERWCNSLRKPSLQGLSLPPVNPFLATDFTLYSPATVDETKKAEVETFLTDYGVTAVRKDVGHHKTFKASIKWSGISPCACISPINRFYMRVMNGILGDTLAEESYFGLLAAIKNEVEMGASGLTLVLTGPQHRLLDFFFALFEKLFTPADLHATEEKYNDYAEASLRSLRSAASKQPYELANDRFTKAVKVVAYTFEEVLDAARSASYEGYRAFVVEYLAKGIYFECFVAGNIPSASYIREGLVAKIEETLARLGVPAASKDAIPRFRDTYALVRPAPPHQHLPIPPVSVISYPPFNEDNSNIAVLFNIYVGEECPLTRVLCDCTNKLISSMFFNALRTRETLGYVVFSRSVRHEGTAHIQFVAQSAVEGVDGLYIFSRIIAFLTAVENNLALVFNEKDFQTVVSSLIELRRKLPDTVEMDCAHLASSYLHPSGKNYREAEISALQELTVSQAQQFFLTHVANTSVSRNALLIVVNNAASAGTQTFLPLVG
ncbi:Insulinase (Peptidase family M16) Peptidase M16 inactive domain [Trypanosoma vivax]|nr:Insulinase (Peptidase family M16) Peptidase M16 inactive domain [Trypanosoma vivax]